VAKSGAQRQAEWRARQAAKLAAQTSALALKTGPAAASGEGAQTAPGVLAALDGIRRLLATQNERLTQLEHRERDLLILRHLTEIRRALGLTELHRPPVGHTRYRPMGESR